MSIYRTRTGLFALILLAAGCIQYNPPVPVISAVPEYESALEYYNKLATLSRPDLQVEYDRLLTQRPALDEVIYITRMALLLTVPETWTDAINEERALGFLEELNSYEYRELDETRRSYLQFGFVWKEVLKQRWNLREVNRKLSDTQNSITDIEAENRELKKQIEALKVIEQQINQHERVQE